MTVQYIWRNCKYRHKKWGVEPFNAFWVEATLEESEAIIFPRLSADAIAESRVYAEADVDRMPKNDKIAISYCFLISQNLESIDPFHSSYPWHHMWNAYSPFESVPKITINTLEELKNIKLPEKKDETIS